MNTVQVDKIDLHMHTTSSDGTDAPEALLDKVRAAGLDLFSVTDHDTIRSCEMILPMLREDDPYFVPGIEFSCRNGDGKYHILGYGYDPAADPIQDIVGKVHGIRMDKVRARLDYIEDKYGFSFLHGDIDLLFAMPNPGKPHIANLLVKYGYVKDKDEAFRKYLNQKQFPEHMIPPEEAIRAIRASGGVTVLAHPSIGSGNETVTGKDMEKRLLALMEYGLEGVEAYYSTFSREQEEELLHFAERFDLYVTAGSDYHGRNKTVRLGQTNLEHAAQGAPGLQRFLERILGSPRM